MAPPGGVPRRASRAASGLPGRDPAACRWAGVGLRAQAPLPARAAATAAPALQGLAGALWALAPASERSPPLVLPLAQEARLHLREFQAHHLSSVIWASARLGVLSEAARSGAGSVAAARVHELSSQGLSNVLWAYAPARTDDAEVPRAFCAACGARVAEFSPQGLANAAWALARLRSEGTAFVAAVHAEAVRGGGLRELAARDIANLSWAVAALAHGGSPLAGLLAAAAGRRLGAFGPRHLASLAWAAAAARSAGAGLRRQVCDAALGRIAEFGPQGLSNLVWALARCSASSGHEAEELCRAVASEAAAKLEDFSPQGIANLTWALASLPVDSGELWRAASEPGALDLGRFGLRDLANTAWALAATGGLVSSPLLGAVAAEVPRALARSAPLASHGDLAGLGVSVLTAVWALELAGPSRAGAALRAAAGPLLLQLGRRLDSAAPAGDARGRAPCAPGPRCSPGAPWQPSVLLELADRLVVDKPPGWEVDQQRAPMAVGAEPLSAFLRALLPCRRWPIVRDVKHNRGILHRLDVPSSGLVLVAKTHEAYLDLALQLHTAQVERCYVVLCRGWLPFGRTEVAARVAWSPSDPHGPVGDVPESGRAPRSQVSRRGRPSRTELRVLAHATRRGDAFSLVGVRIATGRRHQIRVHMAHVGHATACDGKYSNELVSRSWCGRNFLHRCRLAFHDAAGARREATSPPQQARSGASSLSSSASPPPPPPPSTTSSSSSSPPIEDRSRVDRSNRATGASHMLRSWPAPSWAQAWCVCASLRGRTPWFVTRARGGRRYSQPTQ
ncbi:unnamed protein product [Prorocentrum cordatum]|uniref:Pseudouridine synthase RsuA/RluA-like domain-containing protein n=1 Tax=Prorocentrum cordatum TaxID=2364126 RepID=A0ABN9VBM0_9DINO|nr:unnamed protein product [Polarella glacialis]